MATATQVTYAGYTLDMAMNAIICPNGNVVEVTPKRMTCDFYTTETKRTAAYRVAACIVLNADYCADQVHHIDGKHENNDLSNLVILSRKNHTYAHRLMKEMTAALINDPAEGLRLREEYLAYIDANGTRL